MRLTHPPVAASAERSAPSPQGLPGAGAAPRAAKPRNMLLARLRFGLSPQGRAEWPLWYLMPRARFGPPTAGTAADTIRCALLNAASALLWPMLRVLCLLRLLRHGLPLPAVIAAHAAMGIPQHPDKSRQEHRRHAGTSAAPSSASHESSSSTHSSHVHADANPGKTA